MGASLELSRRSDLIFGLLAYEPPLEFDFLVDLFYTSRVMERPKNFQKVVQVHDALRETLDRCWRLRGEAKANIAEAKKIVEDSRKILEQSRITLAKSKRF